MFKTVFLCVLDMCRLYTVHVLGTVCITFIHVCAVCSCVGYLFCSYPAAFYFVSTGIAVFDWLYISRY
jgi:threonine/homoserine/homoserine lactone efflux protein